MFDKLNKLLDLFIDMGIPGYDCRILKDGECIYHRMDGYADLEQKLPMTGKERYNIYSFSKAITTVAAMQLWEKGLFDLEDPLSKYLPEFEEMTVRNEDGTLRKAENPILIRHLFSMTAGLHYNTSAPFIEKARQDTDGRCPTRETVKYLATEPLLFEPGTRWNYSFCHDVLAAVIEVIAGMRFSEYLKESIFDPLGMTQTTFLLPESELDTIAPQYRFNKELKIVENCGKAIRSYKLGSEYESGGAGGVSTMEDYLKFLEALRLGKLLKKETLEMMLEDRLDEQTRLTYYHEHHSYGLGTRVPLVGKSFDFGWGSAAGMFHLVDLEHGITAVYMQHLLNSPNASLRKTILGPTITNAVLGEGTVPYPEIDASSQDLISNYL